MIIGPCCYKKTVGNVSYTLVQTDDDTAASLGCISNCVFEQDGQPGSRFCFTRGNLPKICNHKGVFCDDELKEKLDELTSNSEEIPVRCCNEVELKTCAVVDDCVNICGTKPIACMKIVPEEELLHDKHCNDYNSRPIDLLVAISSPSCGTTCPTTNNANGKGSCCENPSFRNNCDNKDPPACKCNWTCYEGYYKPLGCSSGIVSCCSECPNIRSLCPKVCSNEEELAALEDSISDECPMADGTHCEHCVHESYSGIGNRCENDCKCNCFCASMTTCNKAQNECCSCSGPGNYTTMCPNIC